MPSPYLYSRLGPVECSRRPRVAWLLGLLLLLCTIAIGAAVGELAARSTVRSAQPDSSARHNDWRPQPIDLVGARITGAEALQSNGHGVRVRWAGPTISDSWRSAGRQPRQSDWERRPPLPSHPAAPVRSPSRSPSPALLFSVFAEWPSADSAAGPQFPSLPPVRTARLCHSVRSAAAHSSADSPPSDEGAGTAAANARGECLIDADSLPRGVTVSLRLLTECDYERWTAEAASSQADNADPTGATDLTSDDGSDGRRPLSIPHRCLSSVSAPWTITLPLLDFDISADDSTSESDAMSTQSHSQNDTDPMRLSVTAADGVALVQDDALLRQDLCAFFNLTSGRSWSSRTGWCMAEVAVCDWYGLKCDANRTAVTGMSLYYNRLALVDPSGDINFVWRHLSTLLSLDLRSNGNLGPLNLTCLVNLERVQLGGWNSQIAWSVLTLPPNSSLLSVDISNCGLWFDLRSTPLLKTLSASHNYAPFELAAIWHTPLLVAAVLEFSLFDSLQPSPDGSGLTGGALTHFVFANLYRTNPALESLYLIGTPLTFGDPDASGSNWPLIVSSSLEKLDLSLLQQLRTGPAGPHPDWLRGASALVSLSATDLLNAVLNTSAFIGASTAVEALELRSTRIVGDLQPLERLSQLTTLHMDASGLRSTLPSNVSAVWPRLNSFTASSCLLHGPLPSFAQLPDLGEIDFSNNELSGEIPRDLLVGSEQLTHLDLSFNSLTGPLPPVSLPSLHYFSINHNQVTGPLPLWDVPYLFSLSFASLPLNTTIPADWWERMPNLGQIDASGCSLFGSIPSPAVPRFFVNFLLSNNQLTGGLPSNLTAMSLDVSLNRLSGPVVFQAAPQTVRSINLAHNQFSCPIRMAQLTRLQLLNLQNAGFTGCNFNDAAKVQLPTSLTTLDISDNAWLPLTLRIRGGWIVLHARNASIVSVAPISSMYIDAITLTTLVLDDNPLALRDQSVSIDAMLDLTQTLQVLSCRRCGLQVDVETFIPPAGSFSAEPKHLQELHLAQNSLRGVLPTNMFFYSSGLTQAMHSVWPLSLRVLDFSSNVGIYGPLPPAGAGYANFATIDLSNTSVSGPIPPSWSVFPSLQRVVVTDTRLTCELTVNVTDGSSTCVLPDWVEPIGTAVGGAAAANPDPSAPTGYHCPTFGVVQSAFSAVALDETYYARTACSCDANYFGRDGQCTRCPAGCSCNADRVQGCWPVVSRGQVRLGGSASAYSDASASGGAVTPFRLLTMLPCARNVAGSSLCNPDGISWRSFYDVIHDADRGGFGQGVTGAVLSSADTASTAADLDLSGWCAAGHTGRLCSQCAAGWFSSGRWCARCRGSSVHAIIVIANVAVLLALIVAMFARTPGAAAAKKGLLEFARLHQSQQQQVSSTLSVPAGGAVAPVAVPPVTWQGGAADVAAAASESEARPAKEPANPLRLLVFHVQQLSLLLSTSAALPVSLSAFLGVASAGANGFSLSSLVAIECLSVKTWGLRERCWMALLAPAAVAVVALAVWLAGCRRRAPVRRALSGDDSQSLSESAPDSAQTISARLYGTCVSALYLLVFPCAQTALSALSCTDGREAPALFLNLHPWQQCDDQWRREILPSALFGALLWCVAFPIASTLLLRRLHRRVGAELRFRAAEAAPSYERLITSTDSFHGFAASDAAPSDRSSAAFSTSALSAWSLCAGLLLPFRARLWYWEQLLLARRLALAVAVALIPAHSLYLPLALLSLIQLSALLQHWAQPYRHSLLNRAELASLYLLLINYLSALVLQMGGSEATGGAQTAAVWTALLFAANLLFVIALLGALFAFARQAAAAVTGRLRGCLAPVVSRLRLGGGSKDDEYDDREQPSDSPRHGSQPGDSAIDVGSGATAVELREVDGRSSRFYSPPVPSTGGPAASVRPCSISRSVQAPSGSRSVHRGATVHVQSELRAPLLDSASATR